MPFYLFNKKLRYFYETCIQICNISTQICIIETYESLSIMNSVMLILNLLLDNLKFTFTDLANQIRSPPSMNELVTVLNLSEAIFNNFTNSRIVRPFLVALTAYFEHVSKFSHNKWLVF